MKKSKNPVAKNCNKFNKPATHKDRKKAMKRGYRKHLRDVPYNRRFMSAVYSMVRWLYPYNKMI
jgi:hypothetical protein